ncbi:MAG: putative porin [Bacteroidales bacterium]|nr:putative porin [Bacteroidales bacterium]
MRKIGLLILVLVYIAPSFGQPVEKDSIQPEMKNWVLSQHFSQRDSTVLDTLLTGLQAYNKMYRVNSYPAYLGNNGTAGISTNYFQRINSDFFFLKYNLPYLNMPEEQVYFNTKTPYSRFSYSTGGGKKKQEQNLGLIFTQNVTPDFNVGINLNLVLSDGQYQYQKASDLSFLFFTSYTGEHYSIFGHFGMNNVKLSENGGIIDDDQLEGSLTEDVATNLNEFNLAYTRQKNRNIQVVQHLSIARFKSAKNDSTKKNEANLNDKKDWARLIHVLQYKKNHKSYSDNEPMSGFYRNVFQDTISTYDSVYYRTFYNSLALDFKSNPKRKFRFAANFGIENELVKYSYNIPKEITDVNKITYSSYTFPQADVSLNRIETLYKVRTNDNISNTSVRGFLVNNMGAGFGWKAEARMYFQGYKAGNFQLEGMLFKDFKAKKGISTFSIYGSIRNERPDYWLNHYASNNFMWDNDFKFENETRVGAAYKDVGRMFRVSANVSLIGNYVYFDTIAMPAQEGDVFMVYGFDIRKDFSLWKFKIRNKINIQSSGNQEVLPVPLLSYSNSTYFEHNFYFDWTNGHLLFQLGFDLLYNTRYYAYAYMPSSGRFYNQKEKEIGNYPFFDAFVNFKVKRTTFFFKFEHVNSGLTGYDFFTVLHYPMNQRKFMLGFSWTFYD